jgi:Uma2 family endonuclease
MSMPAIAPREWTASDVRALPDDPRHRYECIDGILFVSPSPRWAHQRAVTELARVLGVMLETSHVGIVLVAPLDYELDARTLVQPDLSVVPFFDGRPPRSDEEAGDPLLFVEVLSPGTARTDRWIKRERYRRAGIEYWIVDLDARLVEQWRPGDDRPLVHSTHFGWTPTGATVALQVEVERFFDSILGPTP